MARQKCGCGHCLLDKEKSDTLKKCIGPLCKVNILVRCKNSVCKNHILKPFKFTPSSVNSKGSNDSGATSHDSDSEEKSTISAKKEIMEAEGGEFKSKSVNNSNNSGDERNEIMEVEESSKNEVIPLEEKDEEPPQLIKNSVKRKAIKTEDEEEDNDDEEYDDDDEEEEKKEDKKDYSKKANKDKSIPNNFDANKKYLENKGLSHLFDDEFLILSGDQNTDVDATKLSSLFDKADAIEKSAINDSNILRLRVLEEFVFVHLSLEVLREKNKSLCVTFNNICVHLCTILEELRGITSDSDKNKFRKGIKRWYNVLIIKICKKFDILDEAILQSIKKNATARSNYAISQENDINTKSSHAFDKIADLLSGTIDNVEFFPKKKIESLAKVVAANNSNGSRGNLLNYRLENVKGDSDGEILIEKYLEQEEKKKIVKKENLLKKKKQKQGPPMTSSPSQTNSTMNKFYQTIKNETDKIKPSKLSTEIIPDNPDLKELTVEALWIKLQNLFKGAQNFDSLLLFHQYSKKSKFGTGLYLDIIELKQNKSILISLISCLDYNRSEVGDNENLEWSPLESQLFKLLQSESCKYTYMKFTPNIATNSNYQNKVNPNGYCFFLSFFTVLMAYVMNQDPAYINDDCSNQISSIARREYLDTYDFSSKGPYKDENLGDKDAHNVNAVLFLNIFTRIEDFLADVTNAEILVEIKSKIVCLGIDGIINFHPIDQLHLKIKKLIACIKSGDKSDFPKDFWGEPEDFLYILFIVNKMTWSSATNIGAKTPDNPEPRYDFMMSLLTEYPFSRLGPQTNLPYHFLEALRNLNHEEIGEGSVSVLNHLTNIDGFHQMTDCRSLFSIKKVKGFAMDAYGRIVHTNQNHYTLLPNSGDEHLGIQAETLELQNLLSKFVISLVKNSTPSTCESAPTNPGHKDEEAFAHEQCKLIRRSRKTHPIETAAVLVKEENTEIDPQYTALDFTGTSTGEFRNYVEKRFASIEAAINQIKDPNTEVWITHHDHVHFKINGAPNSCVITKTQCDALKVQDNNIKTHGTVIEMIAYIINVLSFMGEPTSKLFVANIIHSSTIFNATDDAITTDDISSIFPSQLIELRMKLAHLLIFPFYFLSHFVIIVLIPLKRLAYYLDSLNTHIPIDVQRRVVAKMILYYNRRNQRTAKPPSEWTIVIDGEDANAGQLIQQRIRPGEATNNCGVYAACYILAIGLHSDLEAVIACFVNNTYHSLFLDINPETALYKRKLITVLINDRIHYLK